MGAGAKSPNPSTSTSVPLVSQQKSGSGVISSSNEPAGLPGQLSELSITVPSDIQNILEEATETLERVPLPPRPGFGTVGKEITLYTNYFRINTHENLTEAASGVFEYNVVITPKIDGKQKGKRKRLFRLLEEMPEYMPYKRFVAHDYTGRIVAAKRLPEIFTFDVPLYNDDDNKEETRTKPKGENYKIEIYFIQELDFSILTK